MSSSDQEEMDTVPLATNMVKGIIGSPQKLKSVIKPKDVVSNVGTEDMDHMSNNDL